MTSRHASIVRAWRPAARAEVAIRNCSIARNRPSVDAAILDALEACGGNQSRAAKMLAMSRGALLDKLDNYGVPRPRKN
jgi:DNA-binding NtrC family response regulator